MKRTKFFPALLLTLLLAGGPVAAAPAEEQLPEEFKAALAKRDYVKSREILQPLAEAGNARAQYNLGIFYGEGLGVPQDYAKAREL